MQDHKHKRVMICEYRKVKGREGSANAGGFGDAPRLFRVVEESWRHGLMHPLTGGPEHAAYSCEASGWGQQGAC